MKIKLSINNTRAIALKCGTIINTHKNQVVSILHHPKTEQIIKTVYFNPLILNDYFFNAIALSTTLIAKIILTNSLGCSSIIF